jgi:hypothetical protein
LKATLEDYLEFCKGKEPSMMLPVDFANHFMESLSIERKAGRPATIPIETLQRLYKALWNGENAKKWITENTDIKYNTIVMYLKRNGLHIRQWKDNVPRWDEKIGRIA